MDCSRRVVISGNSVVGSDNTSMYSIAGDNEASCYTLVCLAYKFEGLFWCVVHNLSLAVNDLLEDQSQSKKYMDHFIAFTMYFIQHKKSLVLLLKKEAERNISWDRFCHSKHEISTRWHWVLRASLNYITHIESLTSVTEDLKISDNGNSHISQNELDTLAELIALFDEVRHTA